MAWRDIAAHTYRDVKQIDTKLAERERKVGEIDKIIGTSMGLIEKETTRRKEHKALEKYASGHDLKYDKGSKMFKGIIKGQAIQAKASDIKAQEEFEKWDTSEEGFDFSKTFLGPSGKAKKAWADVEGQEVEDKRAASMGLAATGESGKSESVISKEGGALSYQGKPLYSEDPVTDKGSYGAFSGKETDAPLKSLVDTSGLMDIKKADKDYSLNLGRSEGKFTSQLQGYGPKQDDAVKYDVDSMLGPFSSGFEQQRQPGPWAMDDISTVAEDRNPSIQDTSSVPEDDSFTGFESSYKTEDTLGGGKRSETTIKHKTAGFDAAMEEVKRTEDMTFEEQMADYKKRNK